MGTHILEPIPLLCSHKGEEGEASIAAGGATRGVSYKTVQPALRSFKVMGAGLTTGGLNVLLYQRLCVSITVAEIRGG